MQTRATELYSAIERFMRKIKVSQDKLKDIIQIEKQLKNQLAHEDDTPHTEVTFAEIEEKQKIEAELRRATEAKADALSESSLKEMRLRDERDNFSDDIIAALKEKTGATLNHIADTNQLTLRKEIKIARLDAEKEKISCWARLFCCFFPGSIKKMSAELDDLTAEQKNVHDVAKENEKLANNRIVDLKKARGKVGGELASVAAKPPAKSADLEQEKRRLAQLSYFIQADQEHDQYFLKDGTMLALLRFYAHMMLLREELIQEDAAAKTTENSALLEESGNASAIAWIDKCLDFTNGSIGSKLKHFFCKDMDDMTTTFDEFYDKYLNFIERKTFIEQEQCLRNDGLLMDLIEMEQAKSSPIPKFK